MPTLNLGRVGFVNKGDYIGGTTGYKVNDLVQYGSGTYACIQPHSTEFLPTNILYWQKWTDFGIHQVVNIGSTVRSSADSIYLNAFSGAQTGIISLKITELIAATATAVDMSYMEITITQDDRDKILDTNPHSYKFMIKGNMDVGVWYNVQAVSLGTTDFAPINVRFTRTATNAYIEIGDVGTAWQYPTIEVSHVTDNIITGYTKVFIATLQNSLIGTTTDSLISVIPYNIAPTIHAATAKATPIDADELGIWDSVSGVLKKVTFANMKSIFAVLNSPSLTGTPTAPNFSYKPTPVIVTSWSYATTTITLNVASHTFVAGDYIEVGGLTATTNIPNGVHLVTSVTATTIVFTYALTPTGTAGVSSATVKGHMTTNGRVEGIGVGQTWNDVTGSRALGTTYTNSTGKPIMLVLTANADGAAHLVTLTINGTISRTINLASSTSGEMSTIIPNNGTYSVTSTYAIKWAELR